MDCSQFQQAWEPGTGAAESARWRHHATHCAACRAWQAEQAAVDAWLRTSLRAVVEAPAAPALLQRLPPHPSQPLPPPCSAWQTLIAKTGYAAAAALVAAAMLASAAQPLLAGAVALGG